MEVINFQNVTKIFDKIKPTGISGLIKMIFRESNQKLIALNDISFSIDGGEVIGIIGRNGSGKTTLLRVIAEIYTPNKGKVQITGKLAPLLQIGTGFNKEFDAKQNVMLYGLLLGMSKKDMVQKFPEIMKFAELEEFTEMKIKHYSTGMKTRLGFSTAMVVNPDILLIDEILSVGDQSFKEKSFEAFLKFKNDGKTIVFASHNVRQMEKLCDRVIVLEHGKIVMIGKPEEGIKKYQELLKTQSME